MKKIFTLFVLSFSLCWYAQSPACGQQKTDPPDLSGQNLYPCEEDLIEIMFIENSKVRLRNGEPVDLISDATAGLQNLTDDLEWHTWSRISTVPEEEMDRWAINGELNTGEPVYNMNNIYRLRIPDKYNIWEFCRQLEDLPGIYRAMPVPKPVPLPVPLPTYPPPPGSYQSQQGYLNPASSTPTGIDALYAWTQTGGTGAGVTVCDLEYSWNYNHADISKAAGSQINTNVQDPFNNNNHGTAVIGELVADNNGSGTTGICYGAVLKTCGTFYGSPSPSWNVPGAISIAISNLSAGDVILLEQQWDYDGSGGYVPIEWWTTYSPSGQTFNAVYAAIVTAISNGIHVVEAGGNGNVNTDNLTWYGNSGAIIVGAGGAYTGGTYSEGDLQRLSFSSYGQRFDLQGWGENVVTTGYGDLYSSEGVNYYYTNTFSGTSSASPIVAGAIACAQGYYLANISSTPYSPSNMRSHLATYGTAQITPPSGNIGPRPDLYGAISNFPSQPTNYDWGDAPNPPYQTLSSNNGANHLINPAIFLGNYIDAESDGQPTINADGDDFNGAPNDEDGVGFISALQPGSLANISVIASVQGYLNAWIDFNGINGWTDPGEQIFTDLWINAGTTNLSFTVPAYALIGQTYARFRFTTYPGVIFMGSATDGEVEDYVVFIDEPQPDELDWGDAPDGPYPTLGMNNGAHHMIDWLTFLGNSIDGEPDGQPEPLALGDDNDIFYPPPNDDEDGVTFTSPLISGQNATVDVIASVNGILNAWFDFDGNGSWADPGEHVFMDLALTPGINSLNYAVPGGSLPGQSFARFRFSTQGGLNFDGFALDGEVEDYEIFIEEGQQEEFDWGDAPDGPYPTLGMNNGANHWIDGMTFMGASIDGEPDGQPDPQSLGDDMDIVFPPPNDDEDGVTFTSPLISGQNATVDVIASVPGFLNAWIDFNNNGSWADPNDQIFLDAFLNPGLNNLIFNVPASAVSGNTFARFRFSNAPGLNFDGPAPDGEVEDYQVNIGTGTSDIQMDPDPGLLYVQNEISMAIVPGAVAGVPQVLLAAYNDTPYPGGPGLGVSYSWDGGATWNPLQLPYPLNPGGIPYADMFDPTATADGNGNLYVAHISTDYDWTNGPESGFYIHKSTDGGVSWNGPYTIAYDAKPTANPDPNYRFNDRCQIIADVNPASPHFNNLYAVEIKDRGWNMSQPYSDIYFSRSIDGGITWSAQVILNSIGNMGNMPVPAVASDGTLYVCWIDYNVQTGGTGILYLNISPDGGLTWLPQEIMIRSINLPPLRLNGGADVLAKGAAVIDVSPLNPQEIYITYAEQIAGSMDEGDIFFIRSLDGGNTWTVPIMVNDDGTINDQVMPWMDVKPNGLIDIAWYDRRNDPVDLNWDVYMTVSMDGGNSFMPNVRVNSVAAPSPNTPLSGLWMGEYLGLVVDNTHAYVGFTSSVLDINGDVFFNKLENPAMDIDFGDAPDPNYPTLLVNDGARHMIAGGVYLGASVDPEPDGQPDGTATGDDNDGNNDDDGIIFNQILAGSPAQITVTTSVAGFLQGWMDFNADGDWADPGEQIFMDEFIHFGYTVCLNYLVPLNANLGITTARFRFSTIPGLNYTGLAPDGEVEDYQVEISENPDIKWLQEPCTELPGLHAHDYVLPPYDYIIIADDWLCNGGLVTDIHWWGNYELDAANQERRGSGINYFHLSIHADDPTGTCLPVGQVGGAMWEINVPLAQVNETATPLINSEGGIIYEYSYILEIPFEQEEGLTYWLDIGAFANDPTDPAIWRWQESDRSTVPILCPAVSMGSTTPWQWIIWNTPDPTRYSDMAFAITSEELTPMDFGDAADPLYPTLLASDGARHIIDGVTYMGNAIDPEYNGQPDPNALGDDNDGTDDEDGVTFTTTFVRGQNTSVDIVVSVDGYLNAWIDFNGNGSWADPGEQIAMDVSLTAGTNTIAFSIPSTAVVGTTYARFRFNTTGGLTFTGLANDGEVEDYEVEIEEVPNKWAQYPDPNWPGLHAHDWDYGNYQAIVLADDWICEGGWVTDIHWWGNYELLAGVEQRGSGIDHFHLSIHLTDPSGCLPQDPEIWGIDVQFLNIVETPTGLMNPEGCMIYLYEYYLDEPFPQIEGQHYWLDITAVSSDPTDPAIWRWQESSRMNPPRVCAAANKTVPSPDIWVPIDWPDETSSDMAFIITSEEAPPLDLGDANDPTYPTLLLNSGAAHILDGVTYLGAGVDQDLDGQPDPNALGDDNDGNDDEDGVNILTSFSPGGTAWLDIVASTTGVLNAWIDYNGNGSWSDPGEHFIVDQSLGLGNNWIYPTVPMNVNLGTTYARFRFSTVGGLSYTGIAPDGEVEDHEIIIEGELDFGDAPDQAYPTYPTLLGSDGARHVIDPTIYLGYTIDAEPNGQPDPNALGDDNDGNDDEDGIIMPSILGHGQMTTITVIASANGYLNGWIDFNSSGNWTEADEHIFMDQPVVSGNNILNIYVPPTSVMGTTYARFRYSTSVGLSFTGQAPDGEVEDYEVEIGKPEKWIQMPDLSDLGMDVDATKNFASPDPPMILADDFECTVTGPLTRIEIWGSWLNDYKPFGGDPGAVIFTLSIHEDIPADQSPTGYSMPGDVLWFRTFDLSDFVFEPEAFGLMEGWYNPATGFYLPFGDSECWKYIFPIQEGEFIQEGTVDEPKVYWLDVQAEPLDVDPMCRFGWKTSQDHWNDDAVWTIGEEPYIGPWNELIYPPGHPLHPQSVDLAFAIYGDESPFILLDLTAMLEGPFNGTDMSTSLNIANLIPLNQPYSSDPSANWYYTGTESVPGIPNSDVVDWVMIELRDAPSASGATGGTMVDEKGAFILKDGSIVATDGMSLPKSYAATFVNYPFVVIWHRNHLAVLSSTSMIMVGMGIYSYDFTTDLSQAYLNGQKDLGGGIYGMFGGNGVPDKFIDNLDKNLWTTQAGTTGYLAPDYNMDTQVDNKDKNDIWVPNDGEGTKVPD